MTFYHNLWGRRLVRPQRSGPRRRALDRQDALIGALFVAPQVIGIVVFVVVPILLVLYYSFHEWNILAGTFTFVGLENFSRLLTDRQLGRVLANTATFSVFLVAFNITLALLLAIALNRRFRGVTFFRAAFFSPVVVSLVAWTIVWQFLFQNDGGINGLLSVLGVDGPNWLREGPTAMAAAIIVQLFKGLGLNMVLFLAALQGVPSELTDAARVDGAGRVRTFVSIILPMISPTVLLTLIITVVGSLQVFAQIAVLTQGGPGISTTVLAYYLYQQAFLFGRFGFGSTLAILLFLVVLGLTMLQWQLRKRWVFYEA